MYVPNRIVLPVGYRCNNNRVRALIPRPCISRQVYKREKT